MAKQPKITNPEKVEETPQTPVVDQPKATETTTAKQKQEKTGFSEPKLGKEADPNALHDFEATDKAGHWLGGKRNPGAGKTIKMTMKQAENLLRTGELKQKSDK